MVNNKRKGQRRANSEKIANYPNEPLPQRAEKLFLLEKAAALFFAVLGLAFALSTNKITGGVIGISDTSWLGLVIGTLFFISGILLWPKEKH
jgi:hypothetical protein